MLGLKEEVMPNSTVIIHLQPLHGPMIKQIQAATYNKHVHGHLSLQYSSTFYWPLYNETSFISYT